MLPFMLNSEHIFSGEAMRVLKNLISQCLAEKKVPEDILGVRPVPAVNISALKSVHGVTHWQQEAIKRLPVFTERLVRLYGFRSSETVSILVASLVDETGAHFHEALRKAAELGMSLTWLCFGVGRPTLTNTMMTSLPTDLSRYEKLQCVRERQDLFIFEQKWWTGSFSGRPKDVMVRMLYALPKQTVFADMPNPLDVLHRLQEIVKDFRITPDIPAYAAVVIEILKKIPSDISLLLLTRYSTVSYWRSGSRKINLLMKRYCFLVERILDTYGDRDGLLILIHHLNEYSAELGFNGLEDVVQNKAWFRKS